MINLGLSFALKPSQNIILDFAASVVTSKCELPFLNGFLLSKVSEQFNSEDSIPRRFRLALEKTKKIVAYFYQKLMRVIQL